MSKTVCHYSKIDVIFPNAAPICGAEFWDVITDNESAVTCQACKTLFVDLFPDEIGELVSKLTNEKREKDIKDLGFGQYQ